jgi:hypothetical protein
VNDTDDTLAPALSLEEEAPEARGQPPEVAAAIQDIRNRITALFDEYGVYPVWNVSHQIGDPVYVHLDGGDIPGHVRCITFTRGKVRFAVQVTTDGHPTTLHNVDSALLVAREGARLDMPFDLYS